jgi:hypothetical protein
VVCDSPYLEVDHGKITITGYSGARCRLGGRWFILPCGRAALADISCECSADHAAQEADGRGYGRASGAFSSQQAGCDIVYWLTARIEAEPDITMPELADALKTERDMSATPAMLSRHLIHRLGYTYKKILDRNGAAAQTGARCAIRMAPADAADAP